jgi:GNAT superfamily N-acetyltransferase
MTDMLVKLYALGGDGPAVAGVLLRRALAPERRPVLAWVESRFGGGWAGECEAAFARTPTGCLLALRQRAVLGFAVWDVTARGFFGPIGVDAGERGGGIGAALLRTGLGAMRAEGYAYAIIGGVGPADFFARTVGAVPIPDSTPGIYAGLVKADAGPKAVGAILPGNLGNDT